MLAQHAAALLVRIDVIEAKLRALEYGLTGIREALHKELLGGAMSSYGTDGRLKPEKRTDTTCSGSVPF